MPLPDDSSSHLRRQGFSDNIDNFIDNNDKIVTCLRRQEAHAKTQSRKAIKNRSQGARFLGDFFLSPEVNRHGQRR